MDHEYDDDRPTDRDDAVEPGECPVPPASPADFGLDAPDLATAFLLALDAVDDRRFVTPPLDDLASAPEPLAESAAEPVLVPAPEPEPEPAYETPETMMLRVDDYVIEHEESAYAEPVDTAAARAVAEAFAREQAALELWGSDEASAALDDAATDHLSSEYAASVEAIDSIESIEASHAAQSQAQTETEPAPEAGADADFETPTTISNIDSYYDPETLRLTRPLFSAEEPRAFAAPVYVGDATDGSTDADAAEDTDAEAEVLEDLEEFVAFSLGDTRCVVPIRNVIEIGRIPPAVAVPNAPAWLHGLGNLRGQVLSLIDLRAFLGIGRVRPATGRMLVLRADDDEVQAGLLVDHVHQIVSLSASRFHPVPETLARHYARHAWGVCDYGNFTMIGLEVDSLLGVESMTALGEGAEVM